MVKNFFKMVFAVLLGCIGMVLYYLTLTLETVLRTKGKNV